MGVRNASPERMGSVDAGRTQGAKALRLGVQIKRWDVSRSREDLAKLAFGNTSRTCRPQSLERLAVIPKISLRSSSERFSASRRACRDLVGDAGLFARHSQLPDRTGWPVALTTAEANSERDASTNSGGKISISQQPHPAVALTSQQVFVGLAGFVEQAEATPGSDIIPIIAARAIQRSRGW